MADFNDYLLLIKNAIYGKDVRGAIYDALSYLHKNNSSSGSYTLPVASESTLGGIRLSSDFEIDSDSKIKLAQNAAIPGAGYKNEDIYNFLQVGLDNKVYPVKLLSEKFDLSATDGGLDFSLQGRLWLMKFIMDTLAEEDALIPVEYPDENIYDFLYVNADNKVAPVKLLSNKFNLSAEGGGLDFSLQGRLWLLKFIMDALEEEKVLGTKDGADVDINSFESGYSVHFDLNETTNADLFNAFKKRADTAFVSAFSFTDSSDVKRIVQLAIPVQNGSGATDAASVATRSKIGANSWGEWRPAFGLDSEDVYAIARNLIVMFSQAKIRTSDDSIDTVGEYRFETFPTGEEVNPQLWEAMGKKSTFAHVFSSAVPDQGNTKNEYAVQFAIPENIDDKPVFRTYSYSNYLHEWSDWKTFTADVSDHPIDRYRIFIEKNNEMVEATEPPTNVSGLNGALYSGQLINWLINQKISGLNLGETGTKLTLKGVYDGLEGSHYYPGDIVYDKEKTGVFLCITEVTDGNTQPPSDVTNPVSQNSEGEVVWLRLNYMSAPLPSNIQQNDDINGKMLLFKKSETGFVRTELVAPKVFTKTGVNIKANDWNTGNSPFEEYPYSYSVRWDEIVSGFEIAVFSMSDDVFRMGRFSSAATDAAEKYAVVYSKTASDVVINMLIASGG